MWCVVRDASGGGRCERDARGKRRKPARAPRALYGDDNHPPGVPRGVPGRSGLVISGVLRAGAGVILRFGSVVRGSDSGFGTLCAG